MIVMIFVFQILMSVPSVRTIAMIHLLAVLILLAAVAALSVPVSLATLEMESPVQVWACALSYC